jgi:hypothetical protein
MYVVTPAAIAIRKGNRSFRQLVMPLEMSSATFLASGMNLTTPPPSSAAHSLARLAHLARLVADDLSPALAEDLAHALVVDALNIEAPA